MTFAKCLAHARKVCGPARNKKEQNNEQNSAYEFFIIKRTKKNSSLDKYF
jgi:hypothetical protein